MPFLPGRPLPSFSGDSVVASNIGGATGVDTGESVDVVTGVVVNVVTGESVDVVTGVVVNVVTGESVDVVTGVMVAVVTKLTGAVVDVVTGDAVSPKAGAVVDAVTGAAVRAASRSNGPIRTMPGWETTLAISKGWSPSSNASMYNSSPCIPPTCKIFAPPG